MIQLDLNKLYENPRFDFATKYATYTKTLLAAALYAPLVPAILPIVFIGFIGNYWLDKYNMLRRYSRGPSIGAEYSETFIEWLEYPVILLGVSTWFFQHFFAEINEGNLTLIAAGIGVLNAILPMGWLNAKLFRADEEFLSGEPYSKEKWEFLEDYDRSNPATMEDAMEKFVQYKQKELEHSRSMR